MAKPKTSKQKMKWKSAPPELMRSFEFALRDFPHAQPRKMFGYPAAFVNGNMMGGLFQDTMMLRLSAVDLTAIQEQAGAKLFEPMPGHVMRGYVVVPDAILKSKAQLKKWLGKAFAHTNSLPAKPARSSGKQA